MKQDNLTIKGVMVFVVFCALLFAIFIVKLKVQERNNLSQQVQSNIQTNYSKGQLIVGPYIEVTYVEEEMVPKVVSDLEQFSDAELLAQELLNKSKQGTSYKPNNHLANEQATQATRVPQSGWAFDEKTGQIKQALKQAVEQELKPKIVYKKVEKWSTKVYRPKQYTVDTDMDVEMRKRGIYQASVYRAVSDLSGAFDFTEELNDLPEKAKIENIYLIMQISDRRGLENQPSINLVDHTQVSKNYEIQHIASIGHENNLSMKLPETMWRKPFDFNMNLKFKGSDFYSVMPLGDSTHSTITSNWLHPSYYGLFLPTTSDSSSEGFSAKWQTNSAAASQSFHCLNSGQCQDVSHGMSVKLHNSVDNYLKIERSIKYAYLFILLTFAAFFLFEVLRQLKLHFMHYALVGVALVTFYLLLLSLSEHIGFARSYIAASFACIALIVFYLVSVLRSLLLSIIFGIGLGSIYGFLYATLLSEDYALLQGSIMVFLAVAGFMLMTRKVDWHEISEKITSKSSDPKIEQSAEKLSKQKTEQLDGASQADFSSYDSNSDSD